MSIIKLVVLLTISLNLSPLFSAENDESLFESYKDAVIKSSLVGAAVTAFPPGLVGALVGITAHKMKTTLYGTDKFSPYLEKKNYVMNPGITGGALGAPLGLVAGGFLGVTVLGPLNVAHTAIKNSIRKLGKDTEESSSKKSNDESDSSST